MLDKDQAELDTLTSLTGSAFDKKFTTIMISSHVQTIALFQQAASSNGVPDASLRNFASGKIPTLKEHLQAAQQLQGEIGQ